jgi:predicted KAP-like P-loop ATPase
LPAISAGEVEKVLFSQLDELIKDIPKKTWDQTYWGNVYQGALRNFFPTIRDVTRYINALRFSFNMVKDEVNPVDFLAVTALQIFEPAVYEGIRDNKDLFAGTLSEGYGGRDAAKQQSKIRCDEILSRVAVLSRDRLLDLLTRMFPRVESTYENMGYGAEFLATWRQERRVCSPDKFEVFFRLSIPAGEVSEREIQALLSLASNEGAFGDALKTFTESGRIVRLLERPEDHTKESIPLEHVRGVVNVLMDLGDSFPEGHGGAFERDTSMKVIRLLYQLSRRYETNDQRYALFRDAIEKAQNSIYMIVLEVSLQGQQHGKWRTKNDQLDPEEKRTVSPPQLEDLEKRAVEKIESWARDRRLLDHPQLISILYMWKRWVPDADQRVSAFVDSVIGNDDGLLTFIAAFENKAFVQSWGDHVGRIDYRINPKTVEDFVAVESIEPRLRAIAASAVFTQLSAEKQRSIRTFLDTIDGKKREW